MIDHQGRDAREALIAVLGTAASVGIDIDQLCHLAAEELLSDDVREDVRPYAAGAIYQIGVCMDSVKWPDLL